jgi:hypothetical protein
MIQRRHIALLAVLGLFLAAAPADDGIGDKIVAYAKEHKWEQVGNGECAVLVTSAFKAVGAARRGADNPNSGDYVWGKLVFMIDADGKREGNPRDIKPGDIIQFRDTKFAGRRSNMHYTLSMPHHTSIVTSIEDNGQTVKVLHQNVNGKKTVQEGSFHVADLKEGWMRFYHPLPAE